MKALVVAPRTPEELKFVSQLMKKLGIATKALSLEELEDAGLSIMMKEADRSKKVSREAVMNKLRA